MPITGFEPLETALPEAALSGSVLRAPQPSGGLLVAIPGGGYTGEYFRITDTERSSLLTAAVDAGWDAIAIDRPGYEGSAPVPGHDFQSQSHVIAQAIDAAIAGLHLGSAPVVLVGHSIGGMIALRIAGLRPHTVSALACTGIGTQFRDGVVHSLLTRPQHPAADDMASAKEATMLGPAGSYDPEVTRQARSTFRPTPAEELRHAVAFPDELPMIGAAIRCPVHYRVGSEDALWQADQPHCIAFASQFPGSPGVDAGVLPGVGHSVDHHFGADHLHHAQLQFFADALQHHG